MKSNLKSLSFFLWIIAAHLISSCNETTTAHPKDIILLYLLGLILISVAFTYIALWIIERIKKFRNRHH